MGAEGDDRCSEVELLRSELGSWSFWGGVLRSELGVEGLGWTIELGGEGRALEAIGLYY